MDFLLHPVPITVGYNTCSVMDTPNLGRYKASLEAVPPPITAGYTTWNVNGVFVITGKTRKYKMGVSLFHVGNQIMYLEARSEKSNRS